MDDYEHYLLKYALDFVITYVEKNIEITSSSCNFSFFWDTNYH